MGAILEIYDTLFIPKDKMPFPVGKLNFKRYDYVLFCVGHKKIKTYNLKKLDKNPIYFDLNNIFKKVDYKYFERKKIKFFELSKPIWKKILITGAAGFIGFHLLKEISKNNNFEITVIDNFSRGKKDIEFNNLLKKKNIKVKKK